MTNVRDERSASPYDSDISTKRHRWRSRTRSPPVVRSRSKSKSPPVEKSRERSPPVVRPGSKSMSKSPPVDRSRSMSKSPTVDRLRSPPAKRPRSPSRSRSPVVSRRSRSRSPDASNPGNNLFVTGLSTRVSSDDLEKCFAKHGKVTACHLVTDPRTHESRGFGFITMGSDEDANRCIKNLHRSVHEGRLITVEKARRSRGRTPTPGRYQGLREKRAGKGSRRRSRSFSPQRRYDRDPHLYSRDRRGRSRSPYGSRRASDDHYRDPYRRHREHSERPVSPRRDYYR